MQAWERNQNSLLYCSLSGEWMTVSVVVAKKKYVLLNTESYFSSEIFSEMNSP
jgi:hypothetical protein